MKKLEQAVYVSWEESERDWGTRPDGCSLHLNEEKYEKFKDHYWKCMPKEVPHEYSRPAGEPEQVRVTGTLYRRIKRSGLGLRLCDYEENKINKKKQIKHGRQRSGWVPMKA